MSTLAHSRKSPAEVCALLLSLASHSAAPREARNYRRSHEHAPAGRPSYEPAAQSYVEVAPQARIGDPKAATARADTGELLAATHDGWTTGPCHGLLSRSNFAPARTRRELHMKSKSNSSLGSAATRPKP